MNKRLRLVLTGAALALAAACAHKQSAHLAMGGPAVPPPTEQPDPVGGPVAVADSPPPPAEALPPFPEPAPSPAPAAVAATGEVDSDDVPIDRPVDHTLNYHTVLKLTRPGILHLDLQGPLTPPSGGLCRSQHAAHPDVVAAGRRVVIHMIPAPLDANVPAGGCQNAEWMDAHIDQPLLAGEWSIDSDTWFGVTEIL